VACFAHLTLPFGPEPDQQMALRPLDRDAIDELRGEWLGDHPSLAGLSDRIH
jgi:hypothetical protein